MRPMLIRMLCLGLAALAAGQVFAAESQILFEDGRSDYQIFIEVNAPESVALAARELQHYVQLAGGVRLPIVQAEQAPAEPFISLGDNEASRAAGLEADDLAVEGYRILTRDGNLYILGPDTPDGEHTEHGGTSTGTLNGVYTFLEDYLDIRWLIPGPMGEDVPKLERLVLPAIDRMDQPGFQRRRIPYIQGGEPEVKAWRRRNKQGESLQLDHGHNWRDTISAELYAEHPDWFPMFDGKRVPPKGTYKLETTNPQLVAEYAQRAVHALKSSPAKYTYSVSPSDVGGWSQSPESRALYDTDPDGKLSVTPLVLDFYRNVARRVKQAAPDKALVGYIYDDYLYPPSEGVAPLPDNLYLMIAPQIDYGYRLYLPKVRKRFERIFSAWSSATDKLAYYDLPNKLPQSIGAPMPPALGILEFIYPRLVQYGVKGIYIYGKSAWGTGGVSNYVQAKLNWDPTADPYALAEEFYRRAYGPEAGALVQRIYERTNARMKQLFLEARQGGPNPRDAMIREVFAELYPEIELLYLRARSVVHGDKRMARLEMLGVNLALLQWNLRHRGMIDANRDSPLYRTDQQINAMLTDPAWPLALPPDATAPAPPSPVDPVTVTLADDRPAGSTAPEPLTYRGALRMLLYPSASGPVTIRVSRMGARGDVARYRLMDASGRPIRSGILTPEQPIEFSAQGQQVYFLDVESKIVFYQLDVQGAAFAIKAQTPDGERKRLHLMHNLTPLYFYVDSSTEQFSVSLNSQAPGETVAADILTPSGEVVASLDTSVHPVARAALATLGRGGFWTIRFKPPASGTVDDVNVRLGDTLTPWLVTDPTQLIIVQSKKH